MFLAMAAVKGEWNRSCNHVNMEEPADHYSVCAVLDQEAPTVPPVGPH